MLTALRRLIVRSSLDAWLARWGILEWLRLLWLTAVLWFELASFSWSLAACTWPDSALYPSQERPTHVLLLADPQVRELSAPRGSGLSALHQSVFELVAKRNWFFASRKKPDVVIFMGDMLASWRLLRSDEQYERNYNKFSDIFRIDQRIPSYFVPGNNDVGLNIDSAAARQARNRFIAHFGPLNQKISIRNHTLVMLDAAGLVEEDYLRAAQYIDYDNWKPMPGGPVEFARSLQAENLFNTTILFTHIPLHRPDRASCGPLREKGAIHRGAGPNYQNTLGKKTTMFLLHTIRPQIVFSADDRDYCEYVHVPPGHPTPNSFAASLANITDASAQGQNIREVTLKAFTPSSEIRYPGFQLLSLTTPSSTHPPPHSHSSSFATNACFFPDYPFVYSWRYLPLFLLTTIALILLRRRRLRTPSLPTHLKSSLRKSFSLHSLPTASWSPLPHPPTPFTPDRSPQTPGFFSPLNVPPKRSFSSPIGEFPREHLRAPLSFASSPDSATSSSAGDIETLVTTPTFRATAGAHHLLTGPAHIDADELDDDFAYGRSEQRQPLRVSLKRRSAIDDDDGDGLDLHGSDERFACTFTLNGRRRRISLWLPSAFSRTIATPITRQPGLGGRRRSVRVFARRVGMDLAYIVWPAIVLWAILAWWI